MKSIEERLKKAALGAGCLFLALGAFEMQSHAADAASQVQSRALLVHTATFRGHQGRVLRPDRAILSGQS